MEGCDADPGVAAECIELELRGNEMPDRGPRNIPMGEEQIAPNLDHNPGPLGHRPGPVSLLGKQIHDKGPWLKKHGLKTLTIGGREC
jgi:hypothetical protein